MKLFVSLIVALVSAVSAYTNEALADQVTNLPGAEGLDFKFNQFSGYLTIPGNYGAKHIHYWLVESATAPKRDPLTFWTNGGPGCSGLLGFLTEQGPFRPNKDLSLSLNEYAWNSVSNMVFIEAPAGVGFSYADDDQDYTTGDNQTAIDNYNTIQAFLVRFPEFAASDLYIASESYGGHYMPTLAKQIVDGNTAGVNPTLNFKGFAVGNPLTDTFSGTPAMAETLWGHQLVPKPLYDEFARACSKERTTLRCVEATSLMLTKLGKLNAYALDYPVCTRFMGKDDSAHRAHSSAQRTWMMDYLLSNAGFTDAQKKALGVPSKPAYQPCEDDYATSYMNLDDVKTALHVKTDIKWDECSYKLRYSNSDGHVSMVPIYQYLINGGYGLKILVYSGDDDSVCATVGSQEWIWNMGFDVDENTNWVQQRSFGEPTGYLTKFANWTKLAFVTVHGAGHEVPTYKPAVALNLFHKYLLGYYTGN